MNACDCHCRLRQVRIIVSGVGDYRYVDCVAIRAGKQEALEYIRALFNIPLSHCMAAGDSGNDILMLEGMETGPATASLLMLDTESLPSACDVEQCQTHQFVLCRQASGNYCRECSAGAA